MKKAMRLAPDTGRNTVNTQPERRMFVCEVSVWGESLDCEILAIMKRERESERESERARERAHARIGDHFRSRMEGFAYCLHLTI